MTCPSQRTRFEDGSAARVEIPSDKGPEAFAAVLAEAADRRVPVQRISQGLWVRMQTDDELDEMARLGCVSFRYKANVSPLEARSGKKMS